MELEGAGRPDEGCAIPAGQDLAGEESEKGLLGRKQSSSTSHKVGRSGAYTGSSQFSSAALLGASGGRAWSKHSAGPDASRRVVSLIWKTISKQLLFYFCTLMSLVTIHHHSLISQATAVIACWRFSRGPTRIAVYQQGCVSKLPGAVLHWAVWGWPNTRTGLLKTQQEEQCRCECITNKRVCTHMHTCTTQAGLWERQRSSVQAGGAGVRAGPWGLSRAGGSERRGQVCPWDAPVMVPPGK